MKPKVIAIVGPTASGKTNLSIQIAKALNGEIISADSRQIYKGLDIGTGKVTSEEMAGIPHHLLDVWDPSISISVTDYTKEAQRVISEIISRGKVPIICGGTGHYIDSFLLGFEYPEVPPNEKLRNDLESKSASELFLQLKTLDSQRASTIDAQNKRRLIRALEIIDTLGKVPTKKTESAFNILWIGISLPQEVLEGNISKRLHSRLARGMIEEAVKIHANGLSFARMEDLGLEYKYLAYFLKNKISKAALEKELFIAIRQYAKRQMTWFKKNKEIEWFDVSDQSSLEKIMQRCKQFLN